MGALDTSSNPNSSHQSSIMSYMPTTFLQLARRCSFASFSQNYGSFHRPPLPSPPAVTRKNACTYGWMAMSAAVQFVPSIGLRVFTAATATPGFTYNPNRCPRPCTAAATGPMPPGKRARLAVHRPYLQPSHNGAKFTRQHKAREGEGKGWNT